MPDLLLAGLLVGLPAGALLVRASWRRPAVAVALVPLSFPAGLVPLPGIPGLQVVHVVVAGAVGLVLLRRLRAGAGPPVPPVLLGAGLFVLGAFGSTLVAVDPTVALRVDVGYLLGLALAVAIPAACASPRARRVLALAVCAAGVVVCAPGLTSAGDMQAEYGGALVVGRVAGPFGQPNEYGGFAAVLTVFATAVWFALPRRHPGRVVAAGAVLTGAGALAVSLSRGSWIGVVFGLAVLVVLLPRAPRRRLSTALAVGAVALVTVSLAAPGLPVVSVVAQRAGSFVSGERNPYDQRPTIWAEGFRQVEARPALGGGPGAFPTLAALETRSLQSARGAEHAHNLPLTVAAEQGVVGLLALALTVFLGIVATVRRRRSAAGHGERVLLAGTAAALATALGQGTVDYALRNPVLALFLWLLTGLLGALVSAPRRSPRPERTEPAAAVPPRPDADAPLAVAGAATE